MSLVKGKDGKNRCFWVGENKPIYEKYHDEEWGVISKDERYLFEMLCLEGAHAGLSWYLVLTKRDGYKKAFHNFDVVKVSKMRDEELEALRQDEGIIRNRLKIYSVRKNAISFIKIQKEFGSFYNYIWGFVDGKQIKNVWKSKEELPSKTEISDNISKDLKKRGMSFVGTTIIYSYLQAIGVVSDHMYNCFKDK